MFGAIGGRYSSDLRQDNRWRWGTTGGAEMYGGMRCVCVGRCSVAGNFLGHLREERSRDR